MSRGANIKTSKKKILLAEEIDRALDLKRAGLSIRKIAEAMKVSVGKAHELIERGIASIPAATRDALVSEIHERELALIVAHWPRRGDPKHAAIIQASDKQLREMLGLDAPKIEGQMSLTGSLVDGSESDIARRVRELFGESAAVPLDSKEAQHETDAASSTGAGEVSKGPPDK